MKFKHNKKRNTAFLYEALIRELVKATIDGDEHKKEISMSLVKEFFNKDAILGKELALYKTILEAKEVNPLDAEKILYEVRRVYSTFGDNEVYKTQSRLIAKVNRVLSPNVFSNYVPNYKELATIYQIFNDKGSIKGRIILEKKILENMVIKTKKRQETVLVDNMVLASFVRNFNKKYDSFLPEQKRLINLFVSSGTKDVEFKVFLNEEFNRIKESIESSYDIKELQEDEGMLEGAKKVVQCLKEYQEKQEYQKKDFVLILKMQQLVKELQS